MAEYYVSKHYSPTRPRWEDKTIEAVGDLVGNPLDPRKTISQFHIASFASEVILAENCFIIVGYDPQ